MIILRESDCSTRPHLTMKFFQGGTSAALVIDIVIIVIVIIVIANIVIDIITIGIVMSYL